jgi:hypothetical protein
MNVTSSPYSLPNTLQFERLGVFSPYVYPKPNMVIQEGRKVTIKGLKSAEGKKLNGKKGVAIRFIVKGNDWRWAVKLDESGAKKSIKIQNLEISVEDEFLGKSIALLPIRKQNSTSALGSMNLPLITIGTINGEMFVVLSDHPTSSTWDREVFKAQCLMVGLNPEFFDEAVNLMQTMANN